MIYDARGRVVRVLLSGALDTEERSLDWDRRDTSGSSVVRGVYFVELRAADGQATRKLVLLRR